MCRVSEPIYVARSKVKVTIHAYNLCISLSCSAHNFIQHCEIGKLFGTNDHQDKTMCPVQEPVVAMSKAKFTVHTYS